MTWRKGGLPSGSQDCYTCFTLVRVHLEQLQIDNFWGGAMRMRAIAAVMSALVLSASTAFAGADGSLDIFPFPVDGNGAVSGPANFGACQGTPSPIFGGFGQNITIGIFARLNGASLAGISGAELYLSGIEGLPVGWTASITYPANTITAFTANALFTPRDVGGTLERRQNMTWTDVTGPDAVNCQKAALTEIARIALQQVGQPPVVIPSNTYLKVVAGTPPGNPNFPCPSLLLCNSPFYTQLCVTGGQFIINPSGRTCNVAVAETTWGAVKGMYR